MKRKNRTPSLRSNHQVTRSVGIEMPGRFNYAGRWYLSDDRIQVWQNAMVSRGRKTVAHFPVTLCMIPLTGAARAS
jgi:hypothetical protein